MNIGIDLGGTIVGDLNGVRIPMGDSFEVIKKLSKFRCCFRHSHNVYIVSRVNDDQRNRSQAWLKNYDFFNQTNVRPENLYYCFDRRDKAVFQRGLKLDVFIDNRPDCLIPMEKKVIKILFGPTEADLGAHFDKLNTLENLVIVKNWKQIGEYFKF